MSANSSFYFLTVIFGPWVWNAFILVRLISLIELKTFIISSSDITEFYMK